MKIGGDQLPNAMELHTICGGGDDDRSRLQSYPYLPLYKTATLINNTNPQCLSHCVVQVCFYHIRWLAQHCYSKVLSSIMNVQTGDAPNNCETREATFLAWWYLKMFSQQKISKEFGSKNTVLSCRQNIGRCSYYNGRAFNSVFIMLCLVCRDSFPLMRLWRCDPRADILVRGKFVPCSGRRASTSREQRSSRPRLMIHQTHHQLARPFLKIITF